MRSLELFTGAGGLALGTHFAGFEHRALFEWDHDACSTLRSNAKRRAINGIERWKVEEGDIRNASFDEFGPVDLVAGGVPCQPFSIGGKHQGMRDERDMFPDFLRAIRALRPRAFIVENVKGLLRQSFRNYFAYINLQLTHPELVRKPGQTWAEHLKSLEDFHTKGRVKGLNYNVVFRLLNAADFGVPQTRERVFIVGFRSDVGVDWHFPEPTHSEATLVRDQFITREYWDRHGIPKPRSIRQPAARLLTRSEALPLTRPWQTVRDATCDLPTPARGRQRAKVANHWFVPGARSYVGHTGSFIDWPSKTLKAGVHGVPGGENMIAFADGTVRYLTIREAARMQTFPDGWEFEGAWGEVMRQLGNAVPVSLATTIAKSVATRLKVANRKLAS